MEGEEVPLIPVRTVGITFNLKTGHGEEEEEYDPLETILALRAEIERHGFEVLLYNQDDSFLEAISKTPPDFVLNIAEGRGKSRSREAQVPCILESLGIPYSVLISARVLAPNEARAREGLPPKPGGDELVNPFTTSSKAPTDQPATDPTGGPTSG